MSCDVVGRIGRFCLLSVAFLVIVSPAFAKNWADGTSTWNMAGNWSPAAVPIAGDPVNIVFTDGTARTITYDAPSTPTLGAVSIDLTGAGTAASTLSLTNSSSNNLSTNGGLVVGGYNGTAVTAGRGAVIQSVGTVTVQPGVDMALGHGAGSTGTYTLSGGALVANQSEYMGLSGTGTFNQSAGTNTINSSGVGSFILGVNSTATGNYNLSLTGTLSVTANEYVGYQGHGTFTQTGGTNTIAGAGHNLYIGSETAGVGTYTISNAASLSVAKDVVIGGNSTTGSGTLNIQGTSNISIAGGLTLNRGSLNFSGGTLRFNGFTQSLASINYTGGTVQLAGARFINSDIPTFAFFGTSQYVVTIPTNKKLVVEGNTTVGSNLSTGDFNVDGGVFSGLGGLFVGDTTSTGILNVTNGGTLTSSFGSLGANQGVGSSQVPVGTANITGPGSTWTTGSLTVGSAGKGNLNITGGATVTSTNVAIGYQNTTTLPQSKALVSGAGSSLTSGLDLRVGYGNPGTLTIENGATVYVTEGLAIGDNSAVNLNGGTLRIGSEEYLDAPSIGKINFNAGTLQLAFTHDIGVGGDPVIAGLFGVTPVISAGKGLTIEGTANIASGLTLNGGTFRAGYLNTNGLFQFNSGLLEITGGGTITGISNLGVPTNSEFRASGTQAFTVAGAANSTITATGNLTLGSPTAVNGFGTQGTLKVGANTVTLQDLNDAVFDSLSLATIGSGASPGTISAANGLTLDFGGNITGLGTISTPNNSATPLINNGHIAGTSSTQKITLSGYVKGVGTFANVTTTGTFSPGLSPTIVSTTNLSLASTSTLLMELGGTTVGSGYDQVQDGGLLTLGGVLQVSLINGFTPVSGNSFDLLNWSSLSGTFSTLSLPALGSGLTWNTSQLYTTGVLSVTGVAGTPGDYNNNGIVDAGDYVVWRKYQGTAHVLPNDPTGGTIGTTQYATWRAHFGQPPGSGSGAIGSAGTAVPEPASFVFILLGLVSFSLNGRFAGVRPTSFRAVV